MAKLSRNAPCPCGSGKKYKKCCLSHNEAGAQDQENVVEQSLEQALFVSGDEVDELSNSVLDLIEAEKFDEAESVCRQLRDRYPDQIDGIETVDPQVLDDIFTTIIDLRTRIITAGR